MTAEQGPRYDPRSARVLGGVARYLGVSILGVFVLTAASSMAQGEDVGHSLVGAAVAMLWIAWVPVALGLVVATFFLVLLYYVVASARPPTRLTAIALSIAVWVFAALLLFGFAVVSHSESPDNPMTVSSVLGGFLGFAGVGALFGAVEALAVRPAAWTARDIPGH